jgi:transposase
MKLRKRAYKYRLYPTLDQIPLLSQSFGHVRFVWNQLVSDFTVRQKSVSLVELKALHPFLQTVSIKNVKKESDARNCEKKEKRIVFGCLSPNLNCSAIRFN